MSTQTSFPRNLLHPTATLEKLHSDDSEERLLEKHHTPVPYNSNLNKHLFLWEYLSLVSQKSSTELHDTFGGLFLRHRCDLFPHPKITFAASLFIPDQETLPHFFTARTKSKQQLHPPGCYFYTSFYTLSSNSVTVFYSGRTPPQHQVGQPMAAALFW